MAFGMMVTQAVRFTEKRVAPQVTKVIVSIPLVQHAQFAAGYQSKLQQT
jgi:hypothetical protein